MARAADRLRTTPGSRRIPRRAGAGYRDRPDWCWQASPGGGAGREVQQMAEGARVASVVMFVQDLDRSVAFYTDVLALEVADSSPTAALLSSAGGANLILRAMGRAAPHPLGSVGIQYVVWTAAGEEDLARGERALTARGGPRHDGSLTLVEGRDPDDVPVMISYPGTDQRPTRKLPARIYGW